MSTLSSGRAIDHARKVYVDAIEFRISMQIDPKAGDRTSGVDDQSLSVQFELFADVQCDGFTLDVDSRIIRHFQLFDEISPGPQVKYRFFFLLELVDVERTAAAKADGLLLFDFYFLKGHRRVTHEWEILIELVRGNRELTRYYSPSVKASYRN